MTQLIPQNFGQLSTLFANTAVSAENDLAAGVQASYGLIGYRGKVWSVKHRGDEVQLMREDGDGPRGSIELILLKSSTHIAKIFYKEGFVEGSNAPPDCFSTNGAVPDATVVNKVSPTCANCPMNAWGSRITPAGKQGKMCSDSKRVAVVPMNDPANEAFGGPMLLRIPAASLQDLAAYGTKLGQLSYPYFAVATRISFDTAEAFPKFVFSAIRPLNDAEAAIVIRMRDDVAVTRILAESSELAISAPATVTPAQVFEQPPVQVAPVVVQQAPVQATPVQAAPVHPTVNATATAAIAAAAAFGGAPVAQPAPVQQAPVQPAAQPAPAVATTGFGTVAVQHAQPVTPQVTEGAATNGFGIPDPDAAPMDDLEKQLNDQLSALMPSTAAA